MSGTGGRAHLHPEALAAADLDDASRVERVRVERWIEHPAAARALALLQEAFEQPPLERMENVLLIAESGMGKTMLVRRFERANASAFDEARGLQERPVLVVLMPPEPTPAEL